MLLEKDLELGTELTFYMYTQLYHLTRLYLCPMSVCQGVLEHFRCNLLSSGLTNRLPLCCSHPRLTSSSLALQCT